MAVKKFNNPAEPFKWKHFEGGIILWLVRWYGRYALSYNDLKEIAAERSLFVARSTICRWVHEYSPKLEKLVKPHLKKTCDSWKLDETYLKVKGKWQYLYRAIDKEGQTLDWMLSRHRNKKAAKRFFKKVISNSYVVCPRIINVDKSPTFPSALSELKKAGIMPNDTTLRAVKYLNNRMESDHKPIKSKSRYRQWYQSFGTASKTIAGMETMRLIQKGQLRYIAKGDVRAQNDFINNANSA